VAVSPKRIHMSPRINLVIAALALALVAFPHALEDFHYGDLARFGISLSVSEWLLAGAYALQAIGIVLVLRGSERAGIVLAFTGALWCIGAIVVHGHDMLFAGPEYRHGLISRVLEGLIIALSAASAVLGWRLWRSAAARCYPLPYHL
jgi:hypothetical protein